MSPADATHNFILLPELKLITAWNREKFRNHYKVRKESAFEVCPKCATPSSSVHDRRWVKIKDHPIRGNGVHLHVQKRRFRCPNCKSVFTEPVQGVRKGFKTTDRYRRGLRWACENYADLKRVQRSFACSSWLVYKVFYEQLELRLRSRTYPWPKTIGIDEHSLKRNKTTKRKDFVSLIVDYKNDRIFELAEGKTADGLSTSLTISKVERMC